MTQFLLRILNTPILFVAVLVGVAIQTSCFASYPLMYLQPDIVLIVVVWCALRRDFTEGGILTLLFANISEIHSSAPQGLFLISYMTVFLTIRGLSKLFVIHEKASLVGLTIFASFLWKLTGLMILHLIDQGENQWRHTIALLIPGAVMEAVVGVWAYRLLDRFDWETYKNPRARQIAEDETFLEEETVL